MYKSFEEIVATELKASGLEQQLPKTLAMMEMAGPEAFARFNNSIFIFTPRGEGIVTFAMCNADELQDMAKSLDQFGDFLKACGYTKAMFKTKRKAMFRLCKGSHYKFTYQWSEEDKHWIGEAYLNV